MFSVATPKGQADVSYYLANSQDRIRERSKQERKEER
jgi:hypothetical protein